MATKVIQWMTGTGNITLTYTGEGDGTIVVSSDNNNLSVARSQQITVKTTDGSKSQTVTISQAAKVRNYLKFTALESGTFTLTIPQYVNTNRFISVSYSLDNGATWVTTQNVSGQSVVVTTPTVAQGDTVLWKGSGISMADSANTSSFSKFSSSGDFSASGNIMSLLYDDFESKTTLESNYTFWRLFDSSKVTTSPELPSTGLSSYCYGGMFMYCSKLTTPPELPATILATGCYQDMFYYCTSLSTAPELPATTLERNCYKELFGYCRLVNYIKAMFITEPSNTYTENWVQSVSSTGTFVKNVEATWDVRGNNGIPTNWTVETAPRNYLKFTALESGTFSLRLPSIVNADRMTSVSYSVDDGATWVTTINDNTDITITTPTIAAGDSVLWKGTGVTMAYHYNAGNFCNFSSTGSFAASGNIMSLLFENTFENEKVLPNSRFTFLKLFMGCTGMTTPPELPATTLRNYCYSSLFSGCTSLTSMPTLPATTLVEESCYDNMFRDCTSLVNTTDLIATSISASCYKEMFEGCTSLVVAPRIKARTFYSSSCYMMFNGCTSLTTIPEFVPEVVGTNCCRWMFRNCTSLTVAPDLPATTAPSTCYQQMFSGCTGLVTIPSILPATSLGTSCYNSMFYGCTAITTAPELPATTLAVDCYDAMFKECSSLVNIQNELPATTLTDSCYREMFYGCPLQKAPDLPALTLAQNCYYQMFMGCRNITSLKCLATNISASNCTYQWLRIVADSATFTKNAEMSSWTRDMNGIPEGWTVENVTRNYLKFTALESGTFTLTIPSGVTSSHLTSISYSLDNGATWTTTTNDSTAITITTPTIAQGGTVLWKGTGTQMAISTSVYSNFSSTGSFQASGNIMSLLYQDTFEDEKVLPNKTYTLAKLFLGCTGMTTPPELPATTIREYCYRNLFDGCTSLTEAPELPAINLNRYCYQYMFSGCTSLTTMPELPATTTIQGCYQYMFDGCTSLVNTTELYATDAGNTCYYYMFRGCTSLVTAPKIKARTYGQEACRSMFLNCTSLTTIPEFVPETITGSSAFREMFKNCTSLTVAPELPATTLTSECYRNMFQNCTSLTVATGLPATTLASNCYNNMFRDCGNLNYIKCLATDISASSCTTEWLRGVSATGTFVKNSEMSSWSTGYNGIPTGWTVEDADD